MAKLRGRLWRVTRMVLLVYLGVCLVMSMLQEWVIFPGQSTQGQKHAIVPPEAFGDLVMLPTSNGDRVAVLFTTALNRDGTRRHDAASRPTLMFFYGNAMCLADGIGIARDWQKLGANVLIVEYPGYGMSSGKAGEKPFYAAADAAYDHLSSRGDVDKNRIIPLGLSIGGGVAVDLAARRRVAGVVLLSPFTNLKDMARAALPLLPASLLLRHHFDNAAKIHKITAPVLIIHGRHDSIVPAELSARLAERAGPNLRRIVVETDHNDLFELADEQISRAVAELLDKAMAPQ